MKTLTMYFKRIASDVLKVECDSETIEKYAKIGKRMIANQKGAKLREHLNDLTYLFGGEFGMTIATDELVATLLDEIGRKR